METNYTDNKYSGYGQRNSPISFAEALKNIGIDLVSISTNHSLDYGIEGLQETKRALEGIGYDVVGDNLGESRVKIKTIKILRLHFCHIHMVLKIKIVKQKRNWIVQIYTIQKLLKKI